LALIPEREPEVFEQFDDRGSIDAFASAETNQLVRQAIDELSEDQRQVIELVLFFSMTQMEIADHLSHDARNHQGSHSPRND
jgi:DNA-directed RNA polymerase specialized sigma24 family protein